MIQGIGIDIIEMDRVQQLIARQSKFIDRILTETEKVGLQSLTGHRQVEFIAGRFAAKEAFSKALGTGIGRELGFLDINILTDEKGKPVMKVQKYDFYKIHLSISHSKAYAVAQVIIEENE